MGMRQLNLGRCWPLPYMTMLRVALEGATPAATCTSVSSCAPPDSTTKHAAACQCTKPAYWYNDGGQPATSTATGTMHRHLVLPYDPRMSAWPPGYPPFLRCSCRKGEPMKVNPGDKLPFRFL